MWFQFLTSKQTLTSKSGHRMADMPRSSRSRASSCVGTPRRPRSVSSDLEAHVLRMSFLREQRSSSTPKSAQPTLAQERAAATKRAGHGTEVATSHDKGAEHSAEPSSLPWIVERLFFLSFVALIVYFAPSKAHLVRPEQCAQVVALAELERTTGCPRPDPSKASSSAHQKAPSSCTFCTSRSIRPRRTRRPW